MHSIQHTKDGASKFKTQFFCDSRILIEIYNFFSRFSYQRLTSNINLFYWHFVVVFVSCFEHVGIIHLMMPTCLISNVGIRLKYARVITTSQKWYFYLLSLLPALIDSVFFVPNFHGGKGNRMACLDG